MKNFFSTKEINDLEMYFNIENNMETIIFKDKPILKMYDEYRMELKQFGKNYYQMWEDKEIYQ
jgi:hypothetical protein